MLKPSQRITRLQTHEIICQYSLSSAASLTSEVLNTSQSLVTAGPQQEVCLQKEWNFDTLVTALAYIKLLLIQDQYSLLEDLNTTLNWLQAGVLDIQSNIVNYVQQEKLWQRYMNERTFLSAWDNTLEKTRKHRSQQNKIRTVITTVWQYWGDNVWKRYLNNSRITYMKVDGI